MRCPSCGFENPEGLKFCNDCGTPLRMPCAQCGFANQPQAKFCGECGAALPPHPRASTALPVAPRPHVPLSYTPTYLAEKILTSRSALEGERKQVTVLFADLKGSMELLADRDPEEARQLLDPVLEHMMAAVHRYEGTVNQVMGDGIMALFGAPIAHEDHAVRACYAALAMQTSVKQYAAEVQRTKGVPIHIRVGLNAGEVVVRSIGSDLHMDYTAVGQTTHLAARMEQMAMPGSILITPTVCRLAEGHIQVTSLGPVPVKGLPAPVEVSEVTGAGYVRTRLQAAAARGLTRFVGRDAELHLLHQAAQQAGTGRGQVVAAIGEGGVGKSRLLYELLRSPHLQGWLVLESASASYGKATPYVPVIALLKSYARIEERDDPRTIRAKVTGQLLALDDTLQDAIPALLALLIALPADSPFQQLEPPQRRQRTLAALKRVLLRESQVQPVLLVFEDLHWIDTETQALLDSLVESLPTACLLLLVTYRPEYQHRWGNKTYYLQLRLDPLPPVSAEAFLRALLGDVPSLGPLPPLLTARTEGNPFFLEESVRTLVETGVLVGDRGAYRLTQPVDRLQVPATVQAVLTARIDRLPPEDKRLLQTAAVIGTEIPWPLLQAIAELPEAALQDGLAHLQAAEFLYETRLFPEHAYTFKHALTHEVAYGSLLRERRRALHAHIVEALEGLYTDRLAEQVERLAHHAFRGEVWDKAFTYGRQAGDKALIHAAHHEGVACFEQALAALQHLPESSTTRAQAVDLRLHLRWALYPLGELARGLDHLRAADTLAEALGDPRRRVRVSSALTHHFWLLGDLDRALVSGQRARARAATVDDGRLQAEVQFTLGQVYYSLGKYRQAIDVLRHNVAMLQGEWLQERFGFSGPLAAFSRCRLAWCLAEVGEFPEGSARATEALRLAETSQYAYGLLAAHYALGLLSLRKGDLPQAIPRFEHLLALYHTMHVPSWFPAIAAALGYGYALGGRGAEATSLLEQAIEHVMAGRILIFHALAVAWLAETALLVGRWQNACALAERRLELCHTTKERGQEAWVLRLLGDIAARREPPECDQAETHYRQALTLADELGMRPLQAHCRLGFGTLYAKTGRPEQARAELSIAIDLYKAMDITFWLPEAEAALAQVEGR